ncbi:hypothetical protein GQ457_14G012010 [Hibiscus cannabinus]
MTPSYVGVNGSDRLISDASNYRVIWHTIYEADSSISQEFEEFNPGIVLIVGQQKIFEGKKLAPATKEGSKLDKSEDEKKKNEALKEKFEHPGKEWEGVVLRTLETLVALDFLVLGEDYNRQSLAIGHVEVEGLSHIKTVVSGSDDSISKLVLQLYKLVDMHEVVDVSEKTITLELTGDLDNMVALQRPLEPYGICERQATKDKKTSLLDGLHIICIINESMTVAIVYDLEKKATEVSEKNVVIFDHGDDIFNVSFLLIEESVLKLSCCWEHSSWNLEDKVLLETGLML